MTVLELRTYEGLKEKLGENLTKDFFALLDEKFVTTKNTINLSKEVFVSKDEIKRIEVEFKKEDTRLEIQIKNSEVAIRNDLAKVEVSIRNDLSKLEIRLETRMADLETKITKQIFILNLIQLLAIIGSILAIMKFVGK